MLPESWNIEVGCCPVSPGKEYVSWLEKILNLFYIFIGYETVIALFYSNMKHEPSSMLGNPG
jgi:hypothetical protein